MNLFEDDSVYAGLVGRVLGTWLANDDVVVRLIRLCVMRWFSDLSFSRFILHSGGHNTGTGDADGDGEEAQVWSRKRNGHDATQRPNTLKQHC
jgi:hypothetical protein